MTTTISLPALDVAAPVRAAMDALMAFGARERVLPPDVATRREPAEGGATVLFCRAVTIAGLGELRTLTVTAPDLRVVQLLGLPRPDRDVGVFVAEIVLGGEMAPRVVIDLPTPSGTAGADAAAARVLARAHALAGVPVGPNRSGWGTGRHAISRGHLLEDLARSVRLMEAAWVHHLYELVLAPRLDMATADQHFSSLEAWRAAAAQHSHVGPELDRRFGVAWTRRFVHRHWFG